MLVVVVLVVVVDFCFGEIVLLFQFAPSYNNPEN